MCSHDYAFLIETPLENAEILKVQEKHEVIKMASRLEADKLALELFKALSHSRQA